MITSGLLPLSAVLRAATFLLILHYSILLGLCTAPMDDGSYSFCIIGISHAYTHFHASPTFICHTYLLMTFPHTFDLNSIPVGLDVYVCTPLTVVTNSIEWFTVVALFTFDSDATLL